MLVSEMILQLQEVLKTYGDLPVYVFDEGDCTSDVWLVPDPPSEMEIQEGIHGSLDIRFEI